MLGRASYVTEKLHQTRSSNHRFVNSMNKSPANQTQQRLYGTPITIGHANGDSKIGSSCPTVGGVTFGGHSETIDKTFLLL
jgi:hypothetical protein